jgi:peptide/nickel transport system ATP-binding protein
MTALLEISDLRTEIRQRRSTVHAVDGVSLAVEQGECLGIVGESGSGKTMTALSVMRLLPSGGHVAGGGIVLDGTDVAALDEDKMREVRGNLVGMVFQDPLASLNPTMTIGDQIAESVRLHRDADRKTAQARAVEVLDLVGMPRPAERVSNFPHQLSGGMRQRVMIADEPTTALDVTIQKQILELIDNLRAKLGMAVVLITHDLGVIAGHADRVAVMYAGRVVETAATAALFGHPRHPYTEALFEALPEQAADRLYNIPGQPPDLTAPPPACKFAPRCRYAQDKCLQTEPELSGSGSGREYRCYFPVDSPREAFGPSQPITGPGPRQARCCGSTDWSRTTRSLREPCCSTRSGRCPRLRTSASACPEGRCSGWSASRGAGRPPSGG